MDLGKLRAKEAEKKKFLQAQKDFGIVYRGLSEEWVLKEMLEKGEILIRYPIDFWSYRENQESHLATTVKGRILIPIEDAIKQWLKDNEIENIISYDCERSYSGFRVLKLVCSQSLRPFSESNRERLENFFYRKSRLLEILTSGNVHLSWNISPYSNPTSEQDILQTQIWRRGTRINDHNLEHEIFREDGNCKALSLFEDNHWLCVNYTQVDDEILSVYTWSIDDFEQAPEVPHKHVRYPECLGCGEELEKEFLDKYKTYGISVGVSEIQKARAQGTCSKCKG